MNDDNNCTDTEEQIANAIDAAEEIRSPLDDIVKKSAVDPSAPFAPVVLKELARLRKADLRTYETLRAKLKA
jgi:hypothetical protein